MTKAPYWMDESRYARAGEFYVDMPAVTGIAHRCGPSVCRTGPSCCSQYEVRIEEGDVPALLGILPRAARYAPALQTPEGLAGVVDDVEGGVVPAGTGADDLCVLAYTSPEGDVLCSVHTAALEMGLEPYGAKPSCCALWPLTVTVAEPHVISVQEDAFAFPCNTRRTGPGLDDGLADALEAMFGPEVCEVVAARAQDREWKLPE